MKQESKDRNLDVPGTTNTGKHVNFSSESETGSNNKERQQETGTEKNRTTAHKNKPMRRRHDIL